MFTLGRKKVQTDHEEAIAEVYRHMLECDDTTTPEYAKYLEQLERLYKLHNPEKDKDAAKLKDWIPVIGSIGGVLVIIVYESLGHSLTSKAVSFIRKV